MNRFCGGRGGCRRQLFPWSRCTRMLSQVLVVRMSPLHHCFQSFQRSPYTSASFCARVCLWFGRHCRVQRDVAITERSKDDRTKGRVVRIQDQGKGSTLLINPSDPVPGRRFRPVDSTRWLELTPFPPRVDVVVYQTQPVDRNTIANPQLIRSQDQIQPSRASPE